MDNILQINGLYKYYGEKAALQNVSFDVEKGSICGILGPNGAGKTTLLRIINSILAKDAGDVRVMDNPVSIDTSRHLGYMPEERGLYDKMRVEDQIVYFGQLKGGDKKRIREVMNEYLDLFNMTNERRRRIKELSKGNQQKVQIIATIVHEPELVILDEPFSGFDPINGALLQNLIARLHDKGTTLLLSSHNMPAIEEMCSDIALINNGTLLVKDSIVNIKENNKDQSVLLTTREPLSMDLLRDSGTIVSVEPVKTAGWRKGAAYRVIKNENASNQDVLDAVAIQGDIIHFEEALPSLSDIFIKYTMSESSTINNN